MDIFTAALCRTVTHNMCIFKFKKFSNDQLESVKECFQDNNIDFLELMTEDSFPEKIAEFLKEKGVAGIVLKYRLPYLERMTDVSFYSRKRPINEESSFSVLG